MRYSLIRAVLAFAALTGCAYSIILARASLLYRQDTAESIAAAVRLVPFSPDYMRRLADWQQPAHKTETLRRTVRLDPFDSVSLNQLGLAAEVRAQDAAAAERYYLEAARVNHMYLPRWILTNFYFRRNNVDEFLRWAKAALEISPYPRAPIFFQVWAISKDPVRNGSIVPGRSKVLFEYAQFLVENGLMDAAAPAITRALATPVNDSYDPNQVDERRNMAGQVADALINAGRSDDALSVWTALHRNGWTPLPSPTVNAPLTNGDFRQALFGHGFDWIVYPANGVTLDQIADMNKLRFAFSGTEPENCQLLVQRMPVYPGGRYRLTWEGDSASVAQSGGLHWRINLIDELRPGLIPTDQSSPDLITGTYGTQNWEFTAPKESRVVVLALEYARPLGKTRIDGTYSLSAIRVRRLF